MPRSQLRVRTRREFDALTPTQHERRIEAAAVIGAMREDPSLSLRRAAADEGIRPETVQRYAADALERRGGRWRATRADRMPFVMRINSTDGVVERMVRGSRARTVIGRHHNAIGQYLTTGDTTVLDTFIGRRVAGVTLETDPGRLEEQFMRAELEFLEIYTSSEAHNAY
jgi:hypothetical protein